jgi:hypothetical protein
MERSHSRFSTKKGPGTSSRFDMKGQHSCGARGNRSPIRGASRYDGKGGAQSGMISDLTIPTRLT